MISHSLSSCSMPWPCPFRTFSSCLSAPHVIPGLITSNPLPAPMTPSVLVLLEELCDFLTSHPSITQLCIDREVSHQHLTLPPSALPTLETYLGSCSLMLTPLRHPKHIPEIEIEDVIHMLAKATFPMCHLGCTTFGADANCCIMLTLPMHLPIPQAMPSHPATLVCRPGTHPSCHTPLPCHPFFACHPLSPSFTASPKLAQGHSLPIPIAWVKLCACLYIHMCLSLPIHVK